MTPKTKITTLIISVVFYFASFIFTSYITSGQQIIQTTGPLFYYLIAVELTINIMLYIFAKKQYLFYATGLTAVLALAIPYELVIVTQRNQILLDYMFRMQAAHKLSPITMNLLYSSFLFSPLIIIVLTVLFHGSFRKLFKKRNHDQ